VPRTVNSSSVPVKDLPDRSGAGVGFWARASAWLSGPKPPGKKIAGKWVPREEAERQLRSLFEHVADGLVLCDASGKVLMVNTTAAGLLAEAPLALIGRPLTERIRQGAHSAPHDFSMCSGDAEILVGSQLPRPIELRVARMDGDRRWLVTLRDVSDRREAQERLAFMANYDSLTGLPNRVLFRDRLAQAMARAQRSGQPMALMFLDLDRFKLINDSLGHEAGDRLLQHVARTLTACLRTVDSVTRQVDGEPFTLSRLGGDEFTVIAELTDGSQDAALIAARMLEALSVPFSICDREVVISASVGISLYPTDDVDLDGLIRHTDMAMYRSKSLGRGAYSFYSDDLNAAATARMTLEGSLRHAVERNDFQLHFQPKACLRTGRITGVEALLRWLCPGQGMVPPDRFISVLEDTGLILPVGAWVIREACSQLAEWDRIGLPPLKMAVNLSARQFRHLHLASLVEDSLRENYIDPQRLEIELTESLLIEDTAATRSMFETFSRMGVRLAIDDFGTGHSSLSYLKRFNIDTLKVDRSFVQAMPGSGEDTAITTAVIAMARSMKLNVVAEGVETPEQAQLLRELGCDEIQGYLLARPMNASDLAVWLCERLRQEASQRSAFGHNVDGQLQRVMIELPA